MDYGAPRDFDLLFKQYDALRRARVSLLLRKAKFSDQPPWDDGRGTEAETTALPSKPTQPEPGPEPRPLPRVEREAMGPPATSWSDDVAARMAKAEERLNADSLRQDETGLDRAYNNETSPGVFYDPET